jgi:hypothetical protein
MSAEKLRSKDRLILWSTIVMCLVPLVPYAMHGAGG